MPDLTPPSLFRRYPALAARLPYVRLGELPTPVEVSAGLGPALGLGNRLYIKRDDLTGPHLGGNKLRKLEFHLARAQAQGKREVVTFGYAGSNHAAATAYYARQLGLRCHTMLLHQAPTAYAPGNLALQAVSGAEMRFFEAEPALRRHTYLWALGRLLRTGKLPYIIPPGGSDAVGTLGFVNAGLELADQIEARLLPAPQRLYVACSTMGSAVGLALGLQLAGLPTVVHAVRVYNPKATNGAAMQKLYYLTLRLLQQADGRKQHPALHGLAFPGKQLVLHEGFLGAGYAVPTPQSTEAVARLAELEGLPAEPTYTGKALAALVAHALGGLLQDQNVLYWHTFNSRSLQALGAESGVLTQQLIPDLKPYIATT